MNNFAFSWITAVFLVSPIIDRIFFIIIIRIQAGFFIKNIGNAEIIIVKLKFEKAFQ